MGRREPIVNNAKASVMLLCAARRGASTWLTRYTHLIIPSGHTCDARGRSLMLALPFLAHESLR